MNSDQIPENRNSKKRYENPNFDYLDLYVGRLIDEFNKFLKAKNYKDDVRIEYSMMNLIDIVLRVDKREAYFSYFHNISANEYKLAALYAYWLLKFHPFMITDPDYQRDKAGYCVNELFAIFYVMSALLGCGRIKSAEGIYLKKLLYAFRYRNISIDSIMLIVESISDETFHKDHQLT